MATPTLTFFDYVRAAFKRRVKMNGLGYVPVNIIGLILFGFFGLINPGFWFLGAAVEFCYLAFLASSPRFQKLIQGEQLLKAQRGHEQKVQLTVSTLNPQSQDRYRRLVDQCRQILGINAPLDQSGMFNDMRAGSLNQLLLLFIRLLTSREMMLTTLGQVDRKTLEADVDRIQQKLSKAEAESPLARSLAATLDIQKKRLDNLTKTKNSLEVVDAELERIEQQVRLIREESAVAGGPEFISSRLDAVSATLTETSKWMDQNAEFFSSLSTTEDAVAAPAVLPEAPPVPPPPPRVPQKQ